MSENNEQKHIHSLHRFLTSISNCIDKFYNEKYWIKAEISKLNLYTKSGHCYPELIETQDGKQIANASGFIHKTITNALTKNSAKQLANLFMPVW